MTLIFYHKIFYTISVANIFQQKTKENQIIDIVCMICKPTIFIFITCDNRKILEINILIIFGESNNDYG